MSKLELSPQVYLNTPRLLEAIHEGVQQAKNNAPESLAVYMAFTKFVYESLKNHNLESAIEFTLSSNDSAQLIKALNENNVAYHYSLVNTSDSDSDIYFRVQGATVAKLIAPWHLLDLRRIELDKERKRKHGDSS